MPGRPARHLTGMMPVWSPDRNDDLFSTYDAHLVSRFLTEPAYCPPRPNITFSGQVLKGNGRSSELNVRKVTIW